MNRILGILSIVAAFAITILPAPSPHLAPSPSAGDTADSALRQEAWNVFASLLPKNPSDYPAWEIDPWQSKCSVGLNSCPVSSTSATGKMTTAQGSAVDISTIQDPQTKHGLTILQDSLRLAAQVTTPDNRPAGAQPQFAAVRFNPTAVQSILSAEKQLDLGKPPTSIQFLPGSILTKAIWTFIPMTNGASDPKIPLEVSRIADAQAENPIPRSNASTGPNPAPIATIPLPRSAAEIKKSKYWTKYLLNTNVVNTTPSGCAPPQNSVLPLNCLYQFYLDVEKNTPGENLISNLQTDSTRATFKAVSNSCGSDHCLMALMGIHIMVRLADSDQLSQNGTYHWLFMTFWWTGQDNEQNLKEPWKYYQMNATVTPRVESAQPGQRNFCFNPYLEGVQKNGSIANCMNCHTYAAWNPAPGHAQQVAAGVALGSCSLNKLPTPAKQKAYFDPPNGAPLDKIDFVWSLANYHAPPPDTASQNPPTKPCSKPPQKPN